jgi:hypothetical protein
MEDMMCDFGDTVELEVTIPVHLSHTGKERKAKKPIDRCLAGLIKELNQRGAAYTISSCCGHGKVGGEIVLSNGVIIYLTRKG